MVEEAVLDICARGEASREWVDEISRAVEEAGGTAVHERRVQWGAREALDLGNVVVALGSAGVFTALYETIRSYLNRNQNRELTLTKGEVSITVKGHSLPEETELLKKLAPELLEIRESRDDKKYAIFFNSSVYHILDTPNVTICGKIIHGGSAIDIDRFGNKIEGRPGPELFADVPPGRRLCKTCSRIPHSNNH